MRLRTIVAAALAAAALLMLAPAASAYPQFQLSTGNSRCSSCHYSPSGGGLLTEWGRDESADTISRGGNGAFLYGLYEEPDWIKLGVDLRVAAVAKDTGTDRDPRYLAFPMQADTYVLLQKDAWSLYAGVGPRAQARPDREGVLSRLTSREHYAMYRKGSKGFYARAGRFLAPFGLRSQDHTLYVRRDLGFYAFEETYNLSGGLVETDWELHVTAFTAAPVVLQSGGPRESGGVAYYERRLGEDDQAVIGAQTKVARSSTGTRSIVGSIGKYYLEGPEILLMGELDLAYETFDARPGPTRAQLVSYLSVNWWATRGVLLGAAHERFDSDLSIDGVARDGLSLNLQLFPRAKWEIHALGKLELHGSAARASTLGMLQLHYYL